MGRAEDLFENMKRRGEPAIDEFVANRTVEELFLDFKRSSDNGASARLSQTDRGNLAKAISGFGNSEGGVIVWGVDASLDPTGADVARMKVPIQNVKRFEGWLQGAVSGCTLPAHTGVQHHGIDSGSCNGYVVTLIPQSTLAPHQCVTDYKYYMRAGSSFSPVTHSIIAGMLGRRPQPVIWHQFGIYPARKIDTPREGIQLMLELQVVNKGPGISRDIFCNVKLASPGPRCEVHIVNSEGDWIRQSKVMDGMASIVSVDGYKLAPESITPTFSINLTLSPPFDEKLWLLWSFGCEGSPIRTVELENSPEKIQRLYETFRQGEANEEQARQLVYDLFRITP